MGSVGCSLVVDTASINQQRCPADTTQCGDFCAPYDHAGYGCGNPICTACKAAIGEGVATFKCVANPNALLGESPYKCQKIACLDGYDGDNCEINLKTDPLNCSALGVRCAAFCLNGECKE
jgi:hypothetical protein